MRAPLGVQILSISCSFRENLAKSHVGAPRGSWRPLLGEILDPPLVCKFSQQRYSPDTTKIWVPSGPGLVTQKTSYLWIFITFLYTAMDRILHHRSFHTTGIYRNIFSTSDPFATFTSDCSKNQNKVDNYFGRFHVSVCWWSLIERFRILIFSNLGIIKINQPCINGIQPLNIKSCHVTSYFVAAIDVYLLPPTNEVAGR